MCYNMNHLYQVFIRNIETHVIFTFVPTKTASAASDENLSRRSNFHLSKLLDMSTCKGQPVDVMTDHRYGDK